MERKSNKATGNNRTINMLSFREVKNKLKKLKHIFIEKYVRFYITSLFTL